MSVMPQQCLQFVSCSLAMCYDLNPSHRFLPVCTQACSHLDRNRLRLPRLEGGSRGIAEYKHRKGAELGLQLYLQRHMTPQHNTTTRVLERSC